MAGILVAWSRSPLIIGIGIGACIACSIWRSFSHRLTITLSFLGGAALMAFQANQVNEDWDVLPPRETILQLKIIDLFNARKPGHIAGVGRICSADIPYNTVDAQPIAFYLNNVSMDGLQPGLGQVLQCRGVLTYLPASGNENDYILYLLRRDIFLNLNQGEILNILSPPPLLERIRLRALSNGKRVLTYGSGGNDQPGRVLASMVLGERSLLSDEQIELYRRSGTFHLFAVSGLHVGSFALCLSLLSALFRIPGAWRILPVLSGTWTYVWLTGCSPSSVRAGIMISCLTLSRNLLRQPHLFPAMTVSAWLVLVLNPRQILDLGFQLSYGVVASIILIGLPMAQYFRQSIDSRMADIFPIRKGQAILKKFLQATTDLASVSISAGMASMPLIVQHFGLFTPGGLFLGVLLNPLASLTVMLGCLSLMAGYVTGILPAGWIAMTTWPGIQLIEWLISLCLSIPGAVANGNWSWPPTGTLLLLMTLLMAWCLQWFRQNGRVLPVYTLFLPLGVVTAGLSLISINA